MSSVIRDIGNIIDNEYLEYSMYTLENRAIPSAIDGAKPVHRKILYAMLNIHRGKKTKNSDLGSISSLNYHHGEISAIKAVETLTAPYSNNVPLFQGHGNFGSRLIQEAASPRYIFSSLNEKFYDYFGDFEVCPPHKDTDNPEPQTYLPYIPWVLVNGIEGIAVGFATKFLPHDPKHLAKACISYLGGKPIPELIPTFPHFSGTVVADTTDGAVGKYIVSGTINRVKRNTWQITEVPYGHDRESIFNILTKMEEDNKLSDFEDECDKSGFKFTIKLNGEQDDTCASNPLKYFKLEKSVTENYTTLDENGKLKLFDNKSEIIKYFCDYRLTKVAEKLEYDKKKLSDEIDWLNVKYSFIQDVANNKIILKEKKKDEWLTILPTKYKCTRDDGVNLLGISVIDMTEDYLVNLKDKISNKNLQLVEMQKLVPKEVFLSKLKSLT